LLGAPGKTRNQQKEKDDYSQLKPYASPGQFAFFQSIRDHEARPPEFFLLDRNIGPFCTTEVGVRRCGTLRPAMESKPDFQLAVTIYRVL
jgi:hypothetical protein